MGANAQTTVPSFTIGQVLTADQQNQSARTGVPVFATTVERDAAFGGSGEKTLAEGQLAYLEDSDVVQYYDGSGWATVGPSADSGLTLISTTSATSGSSVAVANCFSATYDSYRIMITNMKGSAAAQFQMQLGATTSGYYWGQLRAAYSGGAVTGAGGANDSKWIIGQVASADFGGSMIDLINPNLAAESCYQANGFDPRTGESTMLNQGWLNDTTQYTGFTILTSSGTFASITIRVYGYANS